MLKNDELKAKMKTNEVKNLTLNKKNEHDLFSILSYAMISKLKLICNSHSSTIKPKISNIGTCNEEHIFIVGTRHLSGNQWELPYALHL